MFSSSLLGKLKQTTTTNKINEISSKNRRITGMPSVIAILIIPADSSIKTLCYANIRAGLKYL
jgi:hypothetical protein